MNSDTNTRSPLTKFLRRFSWILVGIVLVAAVAPRLTNMETYATPAEAPRVEPGAFADLPSGRTYYRMYKARNGRGVPLVMIHGFTGNSFVWNPNYKVLASRYDVLLYDLYGRGFSERRDNWRYGKELYERQLRELLDFVGFHKPVVVGMSMGGAIATYYAGTHTQEVSGLVLVDPAGLPFKEPLVASLAKIPLLGDYLTALVFPLFMRQVLVKGLYNDKLADDYFADRYLISARIKGYRRAILQTLRHMDLHGAKPYLKKIAASGMPVRVYWGAEDEVLPVSQADRYQKLLPNAHVEIFPKTGHMSSFEHAGPFNAGVLTMWRDVVRRRFATGATEPE